MKIEKTEAMFRLFVFSVLANALLGSAFTGPVYRGANRKVVDVSPTTPTSSSSWSRLAATNYDEGNNDDGVPAESHGRLTNASRREVLARAAASILVGSTPVLLGSPERSLAAGSANKKGGADEGMVSQTKLASLLKRVPTFAIVDPEGVPYFVVGEDAKLSSYFFLSYGEAKRILDVAISSSDRAIKETKKEIRAKRGAITKEDEEEIGTNPWKQARITSVPLDLAVSLASKGRMAGGYFRLAPSESDIEDALATDGSDDLPEGRVPLFYVEDMTIADGDEEEASPLYFRKDQLIGEWKRQRKTRKGDSNGEGGAASPDVKVTELFATVTEMVRPGGTDDELKKLRFVPPVDSEAKAERCRKGDKEPFRLGERLIVL